MTRRRSQFSFTITILAAFSLVFAAGMALVVLGFMRAGSQAALADAEIRLADAARLVAAQTRALIRPVVTQANVLPAFRPLATADMARQGDLAALLALLEAEPQVQAVEVGLADGTLHHVLRTASLPAEMQRPGTSFALRSVPAGRPGETVTEHWRFLDASGATVAQTARPARWTDPRGQQWYLQAHGAGVSVSTLYALPLIGRPGLSISGELPQGGALSLDITLDRLSAFLAGARASPGSLPVLFTEDGILLGHPDPDRALRREAAGFAWTTLAHSGDTLLEALWRDYATAQLPPGRTRRTTIDGRDMLVYLATVDDLVTPPLLVGVLAPVSDFTGPVLAAVERGLAFAIAALLLGLAGIGLMAFRIARPLGVLTREADAIRRLEFGAPMTLRSRISEVERLADAMRSMKSALRLFGLYVPRDLVRKLMDEGAEAQLGGERRPISVMFTDIEGFTTLAERLDPEVLTEMTSTYFEEMTTSLLAHDASIDKYIGDAVMALWNAPSRDPQHAAHACMAAVTARAVSRDLTARFTAKGWPAMRTRFGLHAGEAVVGNVGSRDRMSYTAMGAMVNLASRLEGLNKYYGTEILVSDTMRREAGGGFVFRPVDLVLPKGAQDPIEIFELVGTAPGKDDDPFAANGVTAMLPAWRDMVHAYRAGSFDEAAALLDRAAPKDDPLACTYRARLDALRAAPPPDDWSPLIRFESK